MHWLHRHDVLRLASDFPVLDLPCSILIGIVGHCARPQPGTGPALFVTPHNMYPFAAGNQRVDRAITIKVNMPVVMHAVQLMIQHGRYPTLAGWLIGHLECQQANAITQRGVER